MRFCTANYFFCCCQVGSGQGLYENHWDGCIILLCLPYFWQFADLINAPLGGAHCSEIRIDAAEQILMCKIGEVPLLKSLNLDTQSFLFLYAFFLCWGEGSKKILIILGRALLF